MHYEVENNQRAVERSRSKSQRRQKNRFEEIKHETEENYKQKAADTAHYSSETARDPLELKDIANVLECLDIVEKLCTVIRWLMEMWATLIASRLQARRYTRIDAKNLEAI